MLRTTYLNTGTGVTNCKKMATADIYDWSSGRHRGIRNRLDCLRGDIAELLQIDPLEKQLVPVPNAPDTRTGSSVEAYIEYRKKPSVTETVFRIQLVLDELEGMLCRFVMNSHNMNGESSDPAVRNVMVSIAARDRITGKEIEELDLRVRELIAKHYPGKPEAFRKGHFKSLLVIEAAKSALADLPTPKRGRPKGTTNKAAKELIHELAGIYGAYSPKPPSRSVVIRLVNAYTEANTEGGNFLKFCGDVIKALPVDYQDEVTRADGGLAALVRNEISRP